DEEKVAVFTEKLAETYNTFKAERPFKTHSGKTITVGGGADDTYGFVLDQKGTYEVLTEAIGQSKDQFIEPAWDRKAETRNAENGDIGDTYIEVSISEQHMWFYKEGKIILDTDVVTGLTSGGRNTPRGVFRVLNKMVNHTMHGSYGTAYCNYWMPLTLGGVGIHDATWRGSFGGNIYTYDGSHGCINTPLSIMPKFYENGYRGMPVIVHD
ncbi:MAG: L,D-transpeptidase, partial [Lachnospiraceae bacterium]|nr:L,D-transpeptidase [Candidatus Equihabitans merdae]